MAAGLGPACQRRCQHLTQGRRGSCLPAGAVDVKYFGVFSCVNIKCLFLLSQLATESRLQTSDALIAVLKVAVSHRDWKHTAAVLALPPSGAAADEATQTALVKLVPGIFELAARTSEASAADIQSVLQYLRAHGVALQDDATAAVLEALAHKGDIEQLRLGYSTLVDMNAQPTSSASVPVGWMVVQ